MKDLEFWMQITLIISMSILLLACAGGLMYAIFSPAQSFREEIEFKPANKEVENVVHSNSN